MDGKKSKGRIIGKDGKGVRVKGWRKGVRLRMG